MPLEGLRFDMLAGSAWAALSTGHLGCCAEGCGGAAQRLGTRHGRKATVNVTVSFTTLLGIDDEPGVLHGYGLIHPAVARRIAGEATWRRVLTDPTAGAVLDYGTTRYALPRHLAEHVIMRCDMPVPDVQLDCRRMRARPHSSVQVGRDRRPDVAWQPGHIP